jgi:hypothetical protein
MADLYAVAGSKIFIGGVRDSQAADFVLADFTGETWVEIDGWETCGALGDSAEAINTALINRKRNVKIKGTNDAGTWENNFSALPADPGQVALGTAQAANDNYSFKVEWSNGETWYFIGLVMSKGKAGGGANTADMRNFTIEVNSNIVEEV